MQVESYLIAFDNGESNESASKFEHTQSAKSACDKR